MKIVALSDTHGQHRQLRQDDVPEGDVLVFAGDMGVHGKVAELRDFVEWFSHFPHEHKVFIAGNHDFCFDESKQRETCVKILEDNDIIYLEEDTAEIEGLTFYGSPFSNTFDQYVFSEGFGNIPPETNILLTHGPPKGKNDYLEEYGNIGSEKLQAHIEWLTDLKAHIYGHVHEQFGAAEEDDRSFNVSVTDVDYDVVERPLVIEVEKP